ncbi:MmcQ/YjbR family DNA-binding protein [Amphiplicatus metriothermophilus]|uniref:Predicted DNA-binding protein, MmcQ/YjbR family n=1 Tax=Amphiplicatus metriothermophilus TaxID=1519374 RepID=A0A239PLE1_9PROT|nr:MmcQ/YjbR family DNA-binding protein [Amphiplicatus metriothermophilus]MBB5517516.1 putative DNA-binding protein (MmcQ/YjbR family) [Amphiplicatus metriothermophilus]SNT68149.1 Predicted DNA-binding protein, MmcQ/YjbR family [Amphiplicatus metriothermophilus]
MTKKLFDLQERLRAYALAFPEAHEDHPWDHIAIKVRKKAFVFLSGAQLYEGKLSMTAKLPVSAEMATTLPYVEPAGYGLGRSGWVTARLGPKDPVDLDLLKGWIAQSYRAVAPKTLARRLDDAPEDAATPSARAARGSENRYRPRRSAPGTARSPARKSRNLPPAR